jgi:hypothetical protein
MTSSPLSFVDMFINFIKIPVMKRLSLLLLLLPVILKAAPNDASLLQQKQPLCIIENKGQVKDQYGKYRPDIDFAIHDEGVSVFISSSLLSYQFFSEDPDKQEMCRIDAELKGADRHAHIVAEYRQPYYEHYYDPAFGVNGAIAHSYKKITYKNVYPNIDKVLYVKNGRAEYDFVIKEGGKVEDIEISYKGAAEISLNEDGSLSLGTPLGTVREAAPICYDADGEKIHSNYKLENGHLRFDIEKYNGELTIDPALEWSTYYGGSSGEGVRGICYDPAGYIYITGQTQSINNIATIGSYQQTQSISNAENAFIAKFDTNGAIQWATYYSGNNTANSRGIAIDALGCIYIHGRTNSITGIATAGIYKMTLSAGQGSDTYIAKFDGTGNRIWGTYYGGENDDDATCISLDHFGAVYIGGVTKSVDSIATSGSHQTQHGNPGTSSSLDGFLAKFDTSGHLIWSTYYGGERIDRCSTVHCDDIGNVYMAGETQSITGIGTNGSHQDVYMSLGVTQYNSAFLVKFNGQGVRQWATYYGDTSYSATVQGLACTNNEVYIIGTTRDASDVATSGSFQPIKGSGFSNGYLAKFSSSGTRLWGTFFGSNGQDGLANIVLSNNGSLYVTGSMEGGSLATACSYQDTCNYCDPLSSYVRSNGILAVFDTSGHRAYATYYGRGHTTFTSICLSDHSVFLGGSATSATNIATNGSHQQTYGGGTSDCILTKFDLCTIPTQPLLTGDTIICPGTDPSYAVDLSVSCDAADFTWALPSGWTGSSTGSTINVVANSNSGTITVTPYNVCGMAGPPASLYVAVLPVVTTPIVTQSGNILSTGNYDFYQWFRNGYPIIGATNQNYTVTQGGTYTVQVWDTGTCDITSAGITLSAENITLKNPVSVYPNPTTGSFTVETNGGHLTIMSIDGKLVSEHELVRGNTTLQLPERSATGIYLLQFRGERDVVNLRLVKQ